MDSMDDGATDDSSTSRMIRVKGDDVEQEPEVELVETAEPDVYDDDDDGEYRYDEDHQYDEANTVLDDEPLAEGEQEATTTTAAAAATAKIKYVVSEDIANTTTFYKFCVALEAVWSASVNRKPWSDTQKLFKLLPPKFLKHLQDSSSSSSGTASTSTSTSTSVDTTTDAPQKTVQSIFPILRLLLPEKDGSRQFQMAESTISVMYGKALGLSENSKKSKMLLYYTDPTHVNSHEGLGDLSLVVQTVVATTKTKNLPSTYTLQHMNEALDTLASLPAKAKQWKSNHDWKNRNHNSPSDGTSPSPNKKLKTSNTKKNQFSIRELRIEWLRQLNDGTFQGRSGTNSSTSSTTGSGIGSNSIRHNNNNHHTIQNNNPGLSPLEHKWLVRILLKKMQYGLGWKKILEWYHPYAAMLWSAHNSLKGICNKICDPEFNKVREVPNGMSSEEDTAKSDPMGLSSYLPQSLVAPQFGIVFSPMLSERTGFGRCLNDISARHRDFIQSEEARKRYPRVPTNCLAFVHPAFCVEPKLDGERFLAHVSRDGIVKMHTRRGVWYSELYSPVLGPAIRRAVRTGFDVILDGEVIAWDSVREETVPFGSNRTIAKLRTDWMARNGMLDARDKGMHNDDNNNRSMNMSNSFIDKSTSVDVDAGDECWLQYVIFDLIYLDGPEANALLSQTVSEHILPRPSAGSIIHLEATERKALLYRIIEPQPGEVEIVTTWIIRPNGRTDAGEKYFNSLDPYMENGYVARRLDSLSYTLFGKIDDVSLVDALRRDERSDEQISVARALAIQKIYDVTVEEQRLEGLLFKDLSTPYYLGEESKTTRYWHKFKPDYFNGSAASDLDLIVIGAYYATGLRNSGKPSSLLCACVDSEDTETFLPVVKVNLNSMDNIQASEFLKRTGYRQNDDNNDDDEDGSGVEDKWQKTEWARKYYPEFISRKSFQPNNENNGWRAQKKEYPDLWIHPNDSAVVTLNAGEIVVSDSFSAGITLRFPRITKARYDADSKDPSNIESEESLREKYWDVQKSRSNTSVESAAITFGSPDHSLTSAPCRFLTEQKYHESLRHRKSTSRKTKLQKYVPVPKAEVISTILSGIVFAVLGGTGFSLVTGSIDYDEAVDHGWVTSANDFIDDKSVITFIRKHGGTYKISANHDCHFVLGGNANDSKVVAYIRAIDNARSQSAKFPFKITSRKGQELANIARSEGVVRWTFVVSLVHRWLRANHTTTESILAIDPDFMKPTVLDYLVRPKPTDPDNLPLPRVDQILFQSSISSVSNMRRAIDLVSANSTFHEKVKMPTISKNWRNICMEHFDESERWIAACKFQKLWPYTRGITSVAAPIIVVYPDVCRGEYDTTGSTDPDNSTSTAIPRRWANTVSSDLRNNWITSALPLLRVMGAFIAPDLNDEVTHVLCDLICPNDEIVYSEQTEPIIFEDRRHGLELLDQLQSLQTNRLDRGKITLISPNWVRQLKC